MDVLASLTSAKKLCSIFFSFSFICSPLENLKWKPHHNFRYALIFFLLHFNFFQLVQNVTRVEKVLLLLLIFAILPVEGFFYCLLKSENKIRLGMNTVCAKETRGKNKIRLFNFESSFSPVKTKDRQWIHSKAFHCSFLCCFFFYFVC